MAEFIQITSHSLKIAGSLRDARKGRSATLQFKHTWGPSLVAENMPQTMTLPPSNLTDFLTHFERSFFHVLRRTYW